MIHLAAVKKGSLAINIVQVTLSVQRTQLAHFEWNIATNESDVSIVCAVIIVGYKAAEQTLGHFNFGLRLLRSESQKVK